MRRVIITLVSLLIAINILLLLIHPEIDRITYVDEWDYTKEMDLRENIIQDGIIQPVEDNHVYFNKQQGEFNSFLVNQGDTVEIGEPLYNYTVNDYYQSQRTLTSEIERLEDEIDSLEIIIRELEDYDIPSNDDSTQVSINDGEYEFEIPNEGQIDTEYQKAQFILQKASELAEKEAYLNSLENQLAELESSGDTITVESPWAGVVSHQSIQLNDPLLTISSQTLQAYGEITEEQRQLVAADMQVDVITETDLGTLEGTISDVSTVPEQGNLEGESVYPINVQFTDGTDLSTLMPGYHVGLDITLNESIDAVVTKENQIINDQIWKMNGAGILEMTNIKTGITKDGWVEILQGAKPHQAIAYDPESRLRSRTTFINALDIKELSWEAIKSEDVDWKKYLIMGLTDR